MKNPILVVALASSLGSSTVSALEFSETWFFGSSYLDSGAFTGNPDTVEGAKFTTNPGPVVSEILASKLGTSALANNPGNPKTDPGGTNYAQGGAQVTNRDGFGRNSSPQSALSVQSQLNHYFNRAGRADPNALYVIDGGGNDVFYAMTAFSADNERVTYLSDSAANLAGLIQRLSYAGARYVMVPLLPDMGGFSLNGCWVQFSVKAMVSWAGMRRWRQ